MKMFVGPPLICCSLTLCSLSENEISDEGARTLAEALQVNQSLQELKESSHSCSTSYEVLTDSYSALVTKSCQIHSSMKKQNIENRESWRARGWG